MNVDIIDRKRCYSGIFRVAHQKLLPVGTFSIQKRFHDTHRSFFIF